VDAAPPQDVPEIFRRFWPDLQPFRAWLGLSLLFVVLSPLLESAGIWLFKILVDDVLTPRDYRAFAAVASAYIGLTILGGAVSFADRYLAVWIGEHFLQRMRTRVFAHLHTLSVSFFDRRRLGDILNRLTGDVAAIESLVLAGIAQSASALIKIGLFTGLMCYLSWQLTLVSLIVVPLFALIARAFSRRIKTASREVRRRSGSTSAVAEESLGSAVLIQAYGRQEADVARFSEQSMGGVRATLAATRLAALFRPVAELCKVFGLMMIVGAGVWQLSMGRITLGGLLAFLVYLSRLYGPVRGLGQLSNTMFAAAAGAERIIELLDQVPDVAAPAKPVALPRPRGELRFDRVNFRYPDTSADVLHAISFVAPAGQTTAVVGASGAGKTTLLKLLLRFYDPTVGRITLDGHDLRELDPARLRSHIAVVLQETLLLDGTIRENILAGRPEASEAELVEAARTADAHEFISALPDRYQTRVGQRGRLLSSGQRQRIAIARALIRDASILLLDEPTTGLDAAAGERVLTPLRRLMSGRTTIVISHNLLTVTDAQQILYLEHGRLTETGTHAELLRNNQRYAHLYLLHHPLEVRNGQNHPASLEEPAARIGPPLTHPGGRRPTRHPGC
jgi:ATP-binding cassette subfamily B protein